MPPEDFSISSLGPCRWPSPLVGSGRRLVDDREGVLLASTLAEARSQSPTPSAFEMAGPRSRLFFDPEEATCGIVTCGGLCPGLNNVIRGLIHTAKHAYGVRRILGFRYGYAGLSRQPPACPEELTVERVERIHYQGGTILGTSRGPQSLVEMAETLRREGVRILFAVGGDGTLAGAAALDAELRKSGSQIAVVGIPKTIDNDLPLIERSFGFSTAVESAGKVILAAHAEAKAAWNGIGLVKLMGRHSGFIAAHATLASSDVNYCLVPENPFSLDGEHGLLRALEERLQARRHAVVVVAEGAGQELLQHHSEETDASGNSRLGDIGRFLRQRIVDHFDRRGLELTLKYIDPSYIIRSQPANSTDSAYCLLLAQHAVHAGMAGKTGLMVGHWNRHFTHVPLRCLQDQRRRIDPQGELWSRVLGTTGQPARLMG